MKEFYSPSKGKTKVGGSGFTGTVRVIILALTVNFCLEIAAHQKMMKRPKKF